MKTFKNFFNKNKALKILLVPAIFGLILCVGFINRDIFSSPKEISTAELSFAERSNDTNIIGKVLPASCASSASATYADGRKWTKPSGTPYPIWYWIQHPDFNPGPGPVITNNWDANGQYHIEPYYELVPNASCYDGIPRCNRGYVYNSIKFTCDPLTRCWNNTFVNPALGQVCPARPTITCWNGVVVTPSLGQVCPPQPTVNIKFREAIIPDTDSGSGGSGGDGGN